MRTPSMGVEKKGSSTNQFGFGQGQHIVNVGQQRLR